MPDTARIREQLRGFDFNRLFIEELGWDRRTSGLQVPVDGQVFNLTAVAQKRGMVAYVCDFLPDGCTPDHRTRRKIELQVSKSVLEHLILYIDKDKTTQIWQWVKREQGRPTACREHTYHRNQPGDALIQKLQAIAFSLAEEESLSLVDVTRRARAAFDVERVTKRFYDDFRKQHAAFLKFITGIHVKEDREWYASVMLNRLMFVYFIQRKGFLDGDHEYLRNRLARTKQEYGKDKFYSFYRYFLLRLFHEGLGGRARTTELEKLLGRIPFLNGGLFDIHELERPDRYGKAVQIPDKAFEAIFDYFDRYQWHLDERPLRADNEINPDVLGYIFEKYINQKQMGAYYTKEDITEYISKNTVLPFLFDSARPKCKIAFENPYGPTVWNLLRDDPDRYIYPAVRQGISWRYDSKHPNKGEPLKESLLLPDDIARGIDTSKPGLIERRKGWNKLAPKEFALPTEIWREVVARRKRCEELQAKLANGEVRDINDLITLNLDIRQFAQDVIENCEGPELLRALWHAIEKITILDPTCGSGAFLFAALNILEPLYEACLDRMEALVEDLDRSGEKHRPEKFSDFRKVLESVDAHLNRRYFIVKSIILNNLFGVDIMEEAVEICKLRFFLKLAAQAEPDAAKDNFGIEPLPDIDFNIRAGNTLVGYATADEVRRAFKEDPAGAQKQGKFLLGDSSDAYERFEEQVELADRAFSQFRDMQTERGMDAKDFMNAKETLHERLKALDEELNRFLGGEYGVKWRDKSTYADWVKTHQPFHWFVEFYGIVSNGGFDVIIGNPPYVEYSKVRSDYTVQPTYRTLPCGNLYTLVLERCYHLARKNGWLSLIMPLSLVCTRRTDEVREVVKKFPAWISTYDMRPGSLFEGVAQRLSILVTQNRRNDADTLFIGGYRRWRVEERPYLIQQSSYAPLKVPKVLGPFPKISLPAEHRILAKIGGTPLARFGNNNSHSIFVHRIVRYFAKALNFVPLFLDARGKQGKSEDYKEFRFATEEQDQITVLLNSTLFYWFWRSHCDGFHCGYNDVYSMPYKEMTDSPYRQSLKKLLAKLMKHLQDGSQERTITSKAGQIRYQEFYPAESKPILDEIDRVLAKHYGFTEEELDFIINYDIKYRMGRVIGEPED